MRAIRNITVRYAALLAVCGLGLLAVSATASAAESWKIEKVALKGEAALATTTKVITPIEVAIPSQSIAIKCKTVTIEKHLTEPVVLNGTITFTECSSNVSGCELPSVKSTPLVSTAKTIAGGKEIELPTKPKTGTTVATVEFKGSKCPAPLPIEGSFTLKSPEGQVEHSEHELFVSSAALKTKVGETSPEVTFKGAIGVKLASEKMWSFS